MFKHHGTLIVSQVLKATFCEGDSFRLLNPDGWGARGFRLPAHVKRIACGTSCPSIAKIDPITLGEDGACNFRYEETKGFVKHSVNIKILEVFGDAPTNPCCEIDVGRAGIYAPSPASGDPSMKVYAIAAEDSRPDLVDRVIHKPELVMASNDVHATSLLHSREGVRNYLAQESNTAHFVPIIKALT